MRKCVKTQQCNVLQLSRMSFSMLVSMMEIGEVGMRMTDRLM